MNVLDVIDSLSMEIEMFDLSKAVSPGGQIGPCDEVVGELPNSLKKFYALLAQYNAGLENQSKEVDAIVEKLRAGEEDITPTQRDIVAEHLLAHQRQNVLDSIFSLSVKEAFPQIAGEKIVGICENWQVFIRPMCEHCALNNAELLVFNIG